MQNVHWPQWTCIFLLYMITACSRKCQNGGTLSSVSCRCSCAGGFTGTTCESECTVCGAGINHGHPPLVYHCFELHILESVECQLV